MGRGRSNEVMIDQEVGVFPVFSVCFICYSTKYTYANELYRSCRVLKMK